MAIFQLTGLSGAGKTTLANETALLLQQNGYSVYVVDGDECRKTICKDLGFSKEDRIENIRRLGKWANELQQQYNVVIITAINPYQVARDLLLQNYQAAIVWINCALEILIQRDTKGLYNRALLPDNHPEKITALTGVNDVYETPNNARLIINTAVENRTQSAQKLYDFILKQLN